MYTSSFIIHIMVLQSLRQRLTLVLLGFLPFHALLVTVGTKMLMGPGHAPLLYLVLWKEILLGVILFIAIFEIYKQLAIGNWQLVRKLDSIDGLILALFILSIIVFYTQYNIRNTQYLYGFKYDFIPLFAFMILRRVSWSDQYKEVMLRLILVIAGIISIYGIFALYLSQEFFSILGYSDLHSLYLSDGPLAAFQQIGGTSIRRLQSTMSGPNQLGLWLLIPFSILVVQRKHLEVWKYIVGIFVLVAMFLTFSRSVWIAGVFIVCIALWKQLPRAVFFKMVMIGGFGIFLFLIFLQLISPSILQRVSSTKEHIARPLEGIRIMIEYPFGLGLGSAGPASNRISDTCTYFAKNSDISWAENRKNVCVFVDGVQKQPLERVCDCPKLPENWYIQIGIEMGILGFILFILFISLVIFTLQSSLYALLPFIGISIAALFLHAWEDSAVAITLYLLMSAYSPLFHFEKDY